MTITTAPKVWQHDTVLWLAPTREEAIEVSNDISGESGDEGWDSEPLDEEALAELTDFRDAFGNEQTGLEAYRERLANGATVEPFGVIECKSPLHGLLEP